VGLNSLKSLNLTNGYPNNKNNKKNNNKVKSKPLELRSRVKTNTDMDTDTDSDTYTNADTVETEDVHRTDIIGEALNDKLKQWNLYQDQTQNRLHKEWPNEANLLCCQTNDLHFPLNRP
jgi:hypothetical protein